jgi:choline kinase
VSAPIRTAVILAAGMGTRLAGQHSESPKGFLEIDAKPIVETSVDKLVAAGIERIVIVTGHLAEFYQKLASRRPGLIETVHNPEFADSGSMYSLYCARARLDEDFLLLESDLVYEERALEFLLQGSAEDAVLMSGLTRAGDEVYIQAPGGLLEQMSKDASELRSIDGELVGICRISATLYRRMCALAAREFASGLHVAYEMDTLVAAAREISIQCPLVADLVWGEIDDERHLKRIRESVQPRLRQLAQRRARR